MSKIVDSIVRDIVDKLNTAPIQSFVRSSVLSPLVSSLVDAAYPYIVGILCLWVLMLLLLVAILILLLRRKGRIE